MFQKNQFQKDQKEAELPVKQVRAAEAWASALGWWARTYPGEPVEMGALMRRSGLIRSTAYAYLREYRQNGFVDAHNVPVAGRFLP